MLSVYNSLGKEVQPFEPIKKGVAKLYHCGPTVYNYAHIGNLRSYVFADVLRRTLEYSGYKVEQVINITDIGHLTSDADSGDDKMVKGLKREGLPLTLEGLRKLADKYEVAFKKDLEDLNIETPQHFPRATQYLKEEIELIKALEQNGFAYKLEDGIYFDTGKLGSNYGKLGGLTPIDESEARINVEGKKSPRDFVLWKLSGENHLGFESPWGTGFPGWHIECSAMSRKLLGQPFDIHTGGIDHIPVHHNNEIAQSEAAYDQPLANYWMHNEFITVGFDEKMAKSAGNTITLHELKNEYEILPLAYRWALLRGHYRKPFRVSIENLLQFQNDEYKKLKRIFSSLPKGNLFNRGKVLKKYKDLFVNALEEDLNTPRAVAIMQELMNDASIPPIDKRVTLLDFDKVLGLKLDQNEFAVGDIPNEIQKLIGDREDTRKNKDFKKSDELREEIKKKGFIVEDSPEGPKISKV